MVVFCFKVTCIRRHFNRSFTFAVFFYINLLYAHPFKYFGWKTVICNNKNSQLMNFIPIRAYDNYITASIELSLLKDAGIVCHIKDEFTITIDPLLSPALGGMKLMVMEDNVAQAQQLLEDSDQLYLQTIPCPSCGHKTLQHIVKTIQYVTWVGKIKSLLVNGQEQQVTKFYRCNDCKYECKELPVSV